MNHISLSMHPIVLFLRPVSLRIIVVRRLTPRKEGKKIVVPENTFFPVFGNLSLNIPWSESLEPKSSSSSSAELRRENFLHEYYERREEKVFLLILPDSNFLLFFNSFILFSFRSLLPKRLYMYSSSSQPEASPSFPPFILFFAGGVK